MKFSFLQIILIVIFFAPTLANANFSGQDNFSTVSGSWGPDNVSGSAVFNTSGGLLNHITSQPPTSGDVAERYWTLNTGSYVQPWALRVDLTIGNFSSSQNASAGLFIDNSADQGDLVRLALFGGPVANRRYYADALTNGLQTEPSGQVFTSSTTVALQLSFDPQTRIISAGYDNDAGTNGYSFTNLFNVNLQGSTTNWGMNNSSEFRVRLRSDTSNIAVSNGQVTFDNFNAVPEPSVITLFIGTFAIAAFVTLKRKASKRFSSEM